MGLSKGIGEIVLARPGGLRDKTLKLRFHVGGLDQPERRKRYASSREEEEEVAAQIDVPVWQSNRE